VRIRQGRGKRRLGFLLALQTDVLSSREHICLLDSLSPMLHRRFLRFFRFRSFMQTFPAAAPSGTRATSTKARLPRLPIPELHKTLTRYITSLEPFILEDEANGAAKHEDARVLREQWAEDFEHGLGKVLQERLQGASLPSRS
jgi:hypothetical protein